MIHRLRNSFAQFLLFTTVKQTSDQTPADHHQCSILPLRCKHIFSQAHYFDKSLYNTWNTIVGLSSTRTTLNVELAHVWRTAFSEFSRYDRFIRVCYTEFANTKSDWIKDDRKETVTSTVTNVLSTKFLYRQYNSYKYGTYAKIWLVPAVVGYTLCITQTIPGLQ